MSRSTFESERAFRRYATSNALLSFDWFPTNRFIRIAHALHRERDPRVARQGCRFRSSPTPPCSISWLEDSLHHENSRSRRGLRARVSARLPTGKVIYIWPVWFFTTFAQTTGNRSIKEQSRFFQRKSYRSRFVEGLDRSSSSPVTNYSVRACSD